MRYIPNSPEERDEMLAAVGLSSADELFRSIPADVQLGRQLEITDPLAESEVIAAMEEFGREQSLRRQNRRFSVRVSTRIFRRRSSIT